MARTFWASVDQFLDQATATATAHELIDLANTYWSPEVADAFFPGSGGDRQLIEALRESEGWTVTDVKATYWFTATANDGSRIEYIEGDLYLRG